MHFTFDIIVLKILRIIYQYLNSTMEPELPIYSESKAYEQFKKIRNRIRCHNAHDIVLKCIIQLNSQKGPFERDYIHPWILFLLIKWTIIYGEHSYYNKKPLTDRNFIYLVTMIRDDLWKIVKGPKDYDNFHIFLRVLANQQFWLEEADYIFIRFGRQIKLFANLPDNHPFKIQFYNKTQIQLTDFLELLFALLSKFNLMKEPFIKKEWFDKIAPSYPSDTIINFLSITSRTFDELGVYLNTFMKYNTPISDQFHEQTPLKRFPLLNINNTFYCYSSYLLSYGVQHIVYDILRNDNVENFMRNFGDIFQIYVEETLRQIPFTMKTEIELKQDLDKKKQIVDFLIMESDANIFIEAKGVELHYRGTISSDVNEIIKMSETSIIKGINQCYSTMEQIISTKYIDVHSKANYFLIITYKDFYLGNGKDFFQDFAQDEYAKIVEKYPQSSFMNNINIYFLSIDDLDLLIETIIDEGKTLSEILDHAVKSDTDIRTKSFVFRQHLMSIWTKPQTVKRLIKEFEYIAGKCAYKLNS